MSQLSMTKLVGNAQLVQQITGQRLGHAFVISGPTGSGRHTLAGILAQTLLCGRRRDGGPCGVCPDCKKVAAGIHPDLIMASAMAEKGKSLSVNQARELHGDAYIAPNEASRKVYLFEQAGQLSVPVQNVLLKLVEEGPPYTAFLFLVEHSGQLLDTVRSRCEELKLTPVQPREAIPFLQSRCPNCSQEELDRAVARSGGILGQALELLQQESSGQEDPTVATEFCRALAEKSELQLVAFMGQREKLSRDELIAMCRGSRRLLHGALRICAGHNPPEGEEVCRALSPLGKVTLLQLDGLMIQAMERLEGNAGGAILLGWLVVSCVDTLKRNGG